MEVTSAPAPTRPEQRRLARARLLEAAVGQLADEGVRGLTHRRVEQRAGLAQGSTKYYFSTIDALIEAVLAHLVEADLPLVLDLSAAERATLLAGADLSPLLARAQAVADAVLARPDLVRARFHLYLAAATNPALRRLVDDARGVFVAQIEQVLPGPGSHVAARFLCALVDGLLLDQVSAPHPVTEAHAAHYLLAAGSAAASLAAQPPQH